MMRNLKDFTKHRQNGSGVSKLRQTQAHKELLIFVLKRKQEENLAKPTMDPASTVDPLVYKKSTFNLRTIISTIPRDTIHNTCMPRSPHWMMILRKQVLVK